MTDELDFLKRMLEVYLKKNGAEWDLKATLLPYGGLGIAQEATLAKIEEPSLRLGSAKITSLSEIQFSPNPERWPVSPPKLHIENDGSHSKRDEFGNYRVTQDGKLLGRIENFKRDLNAIELIKLALSMAQ